MRIMGIVLAWSQHVGSCEGSTFRHQHLIIFFPMCSSRTAPRLKDKVKPSRRVRGSSDCGTPLITSILPLPYKESLSYHQVSSGWLSRGLFSSYTVYKPSKSQSQLFVCVCSGSFWHMGSRILEKTCVEQLILPFPASSRPLLNSCLPRWLIV